MRLKAAYTYTERLSLLPCGLHPCRLNYPELVVSVDYFSYLRQGRGDACALVDNATRLPDNATSACHGVAICPQELVY